MENPTSKPQTEASEDKPRKYYIINTQTGEKIPVRVVCHAKHVLAVCLDSNENVMIIPIANLKYE